MPTYTFRNKTSDDVIERVLRMSELDEFKADNPHLELMIGATTLVHEAGTNLKVDDGFKEAIAKVKQHHRINNIDSY